MKILSRPADRQPILLGEIVKIPLNNGQYAIIDKSNLRTVNRCMWHVGSDGYPRAMFHGKNTYLHKVVMGEQPKGLEIDHINRDKLDNRVENLRIVTRKVNAQNQPLRKNNKSGFRGVHWDKRARKWAAQITNNNDKVRKTIWLGTFDNLKDAIVARKIAEKEIHNND